MLRNSPGSRCVVSGSPTSLTLPTDLVTVARRSRSRRTPRPLLSTPTSLPRAFLPLPHWVLLPSISLYATLPRLLLHVSKSAALIQCQIGLQTGSVVQSRRVIIGPSSARGSPLHIARGLPSPLPPRPSLSRGSRPAPPFVTLLPLGPPSPVFHPLLLLPLSVPRLLPTTATPQQLPLASHTQRDLHQRLLGLPSLLVCERQLKQLEPRHRRCVEIVEGGWLVVRAAERAASRGTDGGDDFGRRPPTQGHLSV